MKYEPNKNTPLFNTLAVLLVITALALLAIQPYEQGVFTRDGVKIEVGQDTSDTGLLSVQDPDGVPVPPYCPEGMVADVVPALVSESEVLLAVYARALEQVKQYPCDFLPKQPEANIESRVLQLDEDGWGVVVNTTNSFNVKMRLQHFSDGTSEINEDVMRSFETMTREAMNEFGFKALPPKDFDQGYTQDFRKIGERCVLEVPRWVISDGGGEEFHTDFVVNCFNEETFEKSRLEQLPFLKGIGEKSVFLMNIELVAEDRATMSITEGLAGGRAWMYKENGEWKTVAKWLQAVPECSVMAGVPEKYWISCYEDENSDVIRAGSFEKLND